MIHAYEETLFPVGHEDTWEVYENITKTRGKYILHKDEQEWADQKKRR